MSNINFEFLALTLSLLTQLHLPNNSNANSDITYSFGALSTKGIQRLFYVNYKVPC